AIDDLELDPDLLAHAREERGAVGGGATRLGRDQARACHGAVHHLVAADAECVERAHDRRLAQHAGGGNALAEPDDAREGIDHAKTVVGRARHEQAAVVGAEIERRIGAAAPVVAAQPVMRTHLRPAPIPRGAPVRTLQARGTGAEGPGLVVHAMPSCCAEACPARRPPPRCFTIVASVTASGAGATEENVTARPTPAARRTRPPYFAYPGCNAEDALVRRSARKS